MNEFEKQKLKEHIENWKETGKFLEKLRIVEIRKMKLEDILISLSSACKIALAAHPPAPTSGLVEMQRIFMKKKK